MYTFVYITVIVWKLQATRYVSNKFGLTSPLKVVNDTLFRAQGYYPDIYSAQEKWQQAGQKFRVLLIDWHLKFH